MGDFALIELFSGSFRVALHSCGMWLTTFGLAEPLAGLPLSSLGQSFQQSLCLWFRCGALNTRNAGRKQ